MNRALMLQVEKNFEEFLNYVRINRAAELLLTTDQTVTYIAMEVGYANVKTFNRNFLRFKVMTPGDFRKRSRFRKVAYNLFFPCRFGCFSAAEAFFRRFSSFDSVIFVILHKNHTLCKYLMI